MVVILSVVSMPDEVIFLFVCAATLDSANTKKAIIKEVNSMGRGIFIFIFTQKPGGIRFLHYVHRSLASGLVLCVPEKVDTILAVDCLKN